MHSGDGPPKSHGAPAGNDNAVRNSGGGAPLPNSNAVKHAGRSDTLKHYHRLIGDAKEFADELLAALVERTITTKISLFSNMQRLLVIESSRKESPHKHWIR